MCACLLQTMHDIRSRTTAIVYHTVNCKISARVTQDCVAHNKSTMSCRQLIVIVAACLHHVQAAVASLVMMLLVTLLLVPRGNAASLGVEQGQLQGRNLVHSQVSP